MDDVSLFCSYDVARSMPERQGLGFANSFSSTLTLCSTFVTVIV